MEAVPEKRRKLEPSDRSELNEKVFGLENMKTDNN